MVGSGRSWWAGVLLGACAHATGCDGGGGPEVPQGWRLVEVGQVFCFVAPSSVRATDARPIDGFAGEMRDADLAISYDYGWYASALGEFDGPLTGARDGELDGRAARFIETPELLAVHVPVVTGQMKFSMIVRVSTPEGRRNAERILRSVRFLDRG